MRLLAPGNRMLGRTAAANASSAVYMEGLIVKRQKAFLLGGVAALCIAFTGFAAAADITYSVDDTVGTGTVMGTITTNGMLGTIANFGLPPNQFFVSYDLTFAAGGQSTTIMGGPAVGANTGPFGFLGGNLTATATDLIWGFNGTNTSLIFQNSLPSASVCWILSGGSAGNNSAAASNCGITGAGGAQASGMTLALSSSNINRMPLSGSVVFATVAKAAVPEPGSLGLLVAGLAGMIGLRKRRV